jgi:hypothetical protein
MHLLVQYCPNQFGGLAGNLTGRPGQVAYSSRKAINVSLEAGSTREQAFRGLG